MRKAIKEELAEALKELIQCDGKRGSRVVAFLVNHKVDKTLYECNMIGKRSEMKMATAIAVALLLVAAATVARPSGQCT